MGKAATVPAPAAATNPLEQFVQKIKKAIDDKRAEVDKAAAEFLNKKGDKNAAKSKNASPKQQQQHQQQPQQQNMKKAKTKKKAADEKEVKEYIAKSYKPTQQQQAKPSKPKAEAAAPAPAAKKAAAAPAPAKKAASAAPAAAKMSKKGAQKVTAADLSDADKAVIGANPATFAGAAAVIVACYAASRAMRKPSTGGGSSAENKAEGKRVADSADLDSAYATPSKAMLEHMLKSKAEAEAPKGGARPDGVPPLPPKPAAKRNIFAEVGLYKLNSVDT
jgi:hypothetical protein